MKKRGLRKYYKKLEDSSFIENFDFSGGENSWFDLYHIHIDDIGLGNKSWKSRKQHLDALFMVADKIEDKLRSYPNAFQYWIEISERDSREDAIYIHTTNPNGTLFPTSIEFDNVEFPETSLTKYLIHKKYDIKMKELFDYDGSKELYFFLIRNDLGLDMEL
jgi:hypothetical protein